MKNLIGKQKGQVIIIILLIMLVALSLALTLTQRSVNDVTTSTQADQASRAYSAAEAGIEKALSDNSQVNTNISLGNNSTALINQSGLMPYSTSPTIDGIEYPKIGRETTAQVWFVDPSSITTPPTAYYNNSRFDLYYGNDGTTDLPAVEVSVVIFANNTFSTKTYYYDSSGTRTTGVNDNNFFQTPACGGLGQTLANGILGAGRKFYCRQTVPGGPPLDNDILKPGTALPCTTANACTLILTRVRFLYINENHSLAIAPIGAGNRLPPQVQIYNSVGTSGQSQKQIQAFRVKDVVLPWFDFAIFSTNEIRK